jgi:hypothetical protein
MMTERFSNTTPKSFPRASNLQGLSAPVIEEQKKQLEHLVRNHRLLILESLRSDDEKFFSEKELLERLFHEILLIIKTPLRSNRRGFIFKTRIIQPESRITQQG